MTLQARMVTAVAGLLFAGGALAADNASLVNRPVRIQVEGLTAGVVPGKLTAVDGCLYVQFDQKTQAGITSVRLDQVTSLQIIGGGGANPSLQAMLTLEPKKCFEEGNG